MVEKFDIYMIKTNYKILYICIKKYNLFKFVVLSILHLFISYIYQHLILILKTRQLKHL